jgi:Bacterial aa3 type cytochrome c oxidase subunit IV
MADHGHVEYATAEGNDLPAHETSYDNFVHLAFVGSVFVINIVIALAIGGVQGRWFTEAAIIFVSTLFFAHAMLAGARVPSVVMLVISLLTLAWGAAH